MSSVNSGPASTSTQNVVSTVNAGGVAAAVSAASVGAPYRLGTADAGIVQSLSSPTVGASVFGNQLAAGTASAGSATTYEMLRWIPAGRRPIAGRIRYRHNRTTSPHAPLQFVVGVAASASANAQNMFAVTWNGAAVVPATAVSAATVEQDLLSDMFPITLVDRNDGFPGWILTLRSLNPQDASTGVFSYTNAATNGSPNSTGSRCFGTRQQTGDFVTSSATWGSFTTTAFSSSVSVVDIEIYYEDGQNAIVAGFGDSVMSGEFSTTGYDGWARRAVDQLRASGKNIDYWNAGWGGQTSKTNLAAAKQIISLIAPRFGMYSPFSSNDGAASASLLAQNKQQAIEFVEAMRRAGCVPILVTPSPNNARDAALQTHMNAVTAWIISYCNQFGIAYINLGAAMGSATDPTLFATGYDAVDGVGGKHPNDSGYSAGGAYAAAVLAQVV